MPTCLPAVVQPRPISQWRAPWPANRPPAPTARDLWCFWQWLRRSRLGTAGCQATAHRAVPARPAAARVRPATISRRLSTLTELFKYAVIDEHVQANPTAAVTRP
jgi:site-specific recombinase XerD